MLKLVLLSTFLLLSYCLGKSPKQETNVGSAPKEVQAQKNMDKADEVAMSMKMNIMEVMTECNDSFRIEMSYLQALNDSGSFPDELDKTPKCFVRCLLERTGVASTEGVYDPQMAAMLFGWEQVNGAENMAAMCAKRNETCKCERAYEFQKCFMEQQIKFMEKPN